MKKLNILAAFDRIKETWSPHVAARLNGQDVRLAKIKGSFDWHHHALADEGFFVVKGAFTMRFRDRDVDMRQGDFIVVPKGVEHMPHADEECWVMLFEPSDTLNTGEEETARTKRDLPTL